jgi:dipeptidyl aminopeptidase/acylaminoacyl peptidase
LRLAQAWVSPQFYSLLAVARLRTESRVLPKRPSANIRTKCGKARAFSLFRRVEEGDLIFHFIGSKHSSVRAGLPHVVLFSLLTAVTLCAQPAAKKASGAAPQTPADPLTLETIMSSSDWIGHPVTNPYWSADGRSILYWLKRDGSAESGTFPADGTKVSDLYRVSTADGTTVKLDAAGQLSADGQLIYDRAHTKAAYIRHGDIFLLDLSDHRRIQISASAEEKSGLRFSADGASVQYQQGADWYSYSLSLGVSVPVAILKTGTDPDAPRSDALRDKQMRLFSTLRQLRADQNAVLDQQKEFAALDPGMAARPIYLGEKIRLLGSALSPDGQRLIAVVEPDEPQGAIAQMTKYVSETGYSEQINGHRYPDHAKPQDQAILLVDLKTRNIYPLSTGSLPGIHDDPLKDLREKRIAELEKAGEHARAQALAAPEKRAVRVFVNGEDGGGGNIIWSEDGSEAAIEMQSADMKDRWIATVDFANHTLVPQHRLHDNAWISWANNEYGWLRDNRTIWLMSEESGYPHLYEKPVDGALRQMTVGRFEVSSAALSGDGRWFYLRANVKASYSYDIYRIPVSGGPLTQVTNIESIDGFALSPDDKQLLILHSGFYTMPQLAVQNVDGSGYKELTQTMTPGFLAHAWITPQIVEVPSSHGAGTIYAKYYGPARDEMGSARPAVIFVHGAGYLQDVIKSWTHYYREQLFNNYLVQQGYVVLDMDYRGSEGYGRDWRVVVYRQMGRAELEDLLDGKAWLVKQHGVDPHRVGVYGGSYGGFMTEMALLRAPGEFAAGAAIRAPSDWADYSSEYSTELMNTPELDPQAYKVSSPIEYAANLQDALLMSHGLLDDNVLAADSIRLYQRFVELHKKNFWLTVYPLDHHAFEFDDDWYDQYRRIDELFNQFVRDAPPRAASN